MKNLENVFTHSMYVELVEVLNLPIDVTKSSMKRRFGQMGIPIPQTTITTESSGDE